MRCGAVCFLAAAFALGNSGLAAEHPPVVVVRGPTVVAFHPPVTQAQMDQSPATNEVLSDFQLYAREARAAFARRGVQFEELYTRSFRVRDGKHVQIFRPGPVEIGYYIAMPGKKPEVEYGVITSDDLVERAEAYFAAHPAQSAEH
jgi:hypothetical protein